MALPSDTVWEVQTTGDDLNGGGFSIANKGATGVDMTYGAGLAVISFTSTLSAVGTTALTDSAAGFLNTMLGNVINIVGQGFYCIVGFTSTSIVTVDRALGTFATTSGKVGGALVSLGMIGSAPLVTDMVIHQKSGAYVISNATANVSGGCFSSALRIGIYGYGSTRLDMGTKPTLTANGSLTPITIITFTSTYSVVANLDIDCANNTTSTGINCGGDILGQVVNCIVRNATIGFTGIFKYVNCAAVDCTTGFASGTCYQCTAIRGTTGFSGEMLFRCTAFDCSGKGFSVPRIAINCIAYSCGSSGFYPVSATVRNMYVNCISYGNTGYGFRSDAPQSILINCASGSNSSGRSLGMFIDMNPVVLSGDPFVDAANLDFSLDTTAGEGAACRAAGFPSTLQGTITTNYIDVGTSQHADPAGGSGGGFPILGGSIVR